MKTVLITGGHKGLGLGSVERIAVSGHHDLVLAGRNLSEVEAVVSDLRSKTSANVRALHMDVSSLESVRAAASRTKQMIAGGEVGPLHVLMCNAGVNPLGTTAYSVDGYEMTFATNHLGHFLLVNLLLNDLQPDGRVVFTASGTHDPATMDGKMVGKAVEPDAFQLANEGKNGKPHSGGVRYATSKLCTILFAYELDRRLRASGSAISSIAFDPGLIVETGLARHAPRIAQRLSRTWLAKATLCTLGVTMGSIPFSGQSLASVAIDPAFAGASGKYLQSKNGKFGEARSSAASHDRLSARKLWEDSEVLVKLKAEEKSDRLNDHG